MPADANRFGPPSDTVLQELPGRALKFLSGAAHPNIYAILAAHGYTEADHEEGWRLLLAASGYGNKRPVALSNAAVRDALAEIDGWDEPNIRLIRATWWRHHREQLEYVLHGVEPATGPAAVLVVKTILDRLDVLAGVKTHAEVEVDGGEAETAAAGGVAAGVAVADVAVAAKPGKGAAAAKAGKGAAAATTKAGKGATAATKAGKGAATPAQADKGAAAGAKAGKAGKAGGSDAGAPAKKGSSKQDAEAEAKRAANAAALDRLAARGITPQVRQHLRDLIQIVQAPARLPDLPKLTEDKLKTDEARHEALLALHGWWFEWSETARLCITRRDYLIQLGLANRRVRNDADDGGDGGGGDGEGKESAGQDGAGKRSTGRGSAGKGGTGKGSAGQGGAGKDSAGGEDSDSGGG